MGTRGSSVVASGFTMHFAPASRARSDSWRIWIRCAVGPGISPTSSRVCGLRQQARKLPILLSSARAWWRLALRASAMTSTHEIRYQSLFDPGRAMTFACDSEGYVPRDTLSDRALANYLFARAAVRAGTCLPVGERQHSSLTRWVSRPNQHFEQE
jgi:hypothetical protein